MMYKTGMALEIERKFKVRNGSWKSSVAESVLMFQGYMCSDVHRAVRVRAAGDRAWLSVKSAISHLKRAEYEYEIPLADARELLKLCPRPPLEKVRHKLTHAGREWVIDEYRGENSGLVVAEIELEREDEAFAKPPWAGEDISADPRYLSACLYENPFSKWGNERH